MIIRYLAKTTDNQYLINHDPSNLMLSVVIFDLATSAHLSIYYFRAFPTG